MSNDRRSPLTGPVWMRAGALLGLVGPLWLAGVIAGLTVAQYEFMRSLRWHPLLAPTTDWPSGLALGPYGGLMVVTFLGCGLMVALFGGTLHYAVAAGGGSRAGPLLLILAGAALALLAFKADPTYLPTPRTLSGAIHDVAFALLGLTLLPGLVVLGFRFRYDPYWRPLVRMTWVTAALVIPAFLLKGLVFYLFLGAIVLWFEIVAVWLLLAAGRAGPSAML
jgi:hypothetical protein